MARDCIVIGAGYAGLAAADALAKAGRGVLVLDARERVGGRARTETTPGGAWLDWGGQWLGPTQDKMYALARRFDARVWPMHVEGRQLLHIRGANHAYTGLYPRGLRPWELACLGLAIARFDQMAHRVPLEAPWLARDAARLDQRTVEDWMRRHLPFRAAAQLFEVAIHAVFAAEPREISLLHALFYARSGGGLEKLATSSGGAQQDRVEGGMQPLAEQWADDLRARGVRFSLGRAVLAVVQGERDVRVVTQRGTFRAQRVISAIPPSLALEVDWRPGLPASRVAWMEKSPPGAAMKVFALYDRPFWRDRGLSGSAVATDGDVQAVFDVTPPTSNAGILMGFVEADHARKWHREDPYLRREMVLNAFARWFGKQALEPNEYVDHCWLDEPWSRGCYAAVCRPGAWSLGGASVRAPHGRVEWAGTETATRWCGYFEGAVLSGEAAAARVIDALRSADGAPGREQTDV